MRIRIQQCNPIVGDIEGNLALMRGAYEQAFKDGVDLLLLPELVVTGYPPMDLLNSNSFCQQVFRANEEAAEMTRQGTAMLFGSVTPHSGTGRRLFNSALLAEDGSVKEVFHKTLLPTYDVFDEDRYFQPNGDPNVFSYGGVSFGVLICEDLFFNANEPPAPTYLIDPAARCRQYGAEVFLVLSASPFTSTKHQVRLDILRERASEFSSPFLFANQIGANTELVFDGDSMAVDQNGVCIAAPEPFTEGWADVLLLKDGGFGSVTLHPADGSEVEEGESGAYPASKEERLFKAIQLGIRDFFAKSGANGKALIGLSGGVDSALVTVLAAAALGPERVTTIGMPSRYSSKGSITDSQELAQRLGVEWVEIPIEGMFNETRSALTACFEPATASDSAASDSATDSDSGTASDSAAATPLQISGGLTEENIQPRLRAILLMGWSNRFGHLLLSTSNKSEISVGYSTLYGDMSGALAPIGDLYKTDVYALCRWLNVKGPFPGAIPESILTKEPSAELRPDQKDTDSLPPYDQLDSILMRYIERQASPREISYETGIQEELVISILKKVDAAEFKRWQSPPILKLSRKAYGPGRRWPIVKKRRYN